MIDHRLSTLLSFLLLAGSVGAASLDAPEMVWIEGGTFQMGSEMGDADEKPPHTVKVRGFFLSKTEVTQRQYKAYVKKNPSRYVGNTLPVDSVSWSEAIAFCNALSVSEGLTPAYTVGKKTVWNPEANGYRLPTEAEWEYAAQGGLKGHGWRYPGNPSYAEVAWTSSNAKGRTHPVAKRLPNELGLYDLGGNVWEWCWDWYGPYAAEGVATNPVGPDSGVYRVGRGGTWRMGEYAARVTNRVELGTEGYKNSVVGLRIARSRG